MKDYTEHYKFTQTVYDDGRIEKVEKEITAPGGMNTCLEFWRFCREMAEAVGYAPATVDKFFGEDEYY